MNETPANSIERMTLRGQKTGADWVVGSKITQPEGGSGGIFSVGYDVTGPSDQIAFLKATDIRLMRPGSTDPLNQAKEALTLHSFERDILYYCSGNRFDRIVRVIDDGAIEVVIAGAREPVFFLVFEKAAGNIRVAARSFRNQGIAWIPRVSHNLAVAISQLHNRGIAHNDIKPSNLLVFNARLQKLGDLGRATSEKALGPWDGCKGPGDRNYSAPEAWGYPYNPEMNGLSISHGYRRRFEMYTLGSLLFFFLTEQSLNSVIALHMRPEFQPGNWQGSFEDIIPHLSDVHGEAMTIMKQQIKRSYGEEGFSKLREVCEFARCLTEIDPNRRGDPQNKQKGLPPYDLRRLISRMNLIATKLEIAERT